MRDWGREHEKRRQRLLELLDQLGREEPFDDASEASVKARRALPLVDRGAETDWCRTYCPHYFDRPFAPVHEGMVGAVGQPGMPAFIGAFRGAGKSVLLSLARPLRRLLSRDVPYLIYGAQGLTLAAQIMDYLRIEIDHNPRIRADYGELVTEGPEEAWTVDLGRTERDDHGRWALREARVEGFGIGMSPRGRRFRQYRPHEFVGDDLETAELARNPEREANLWNWLFDEVVPALEPEIYQFTVLGTMFGPGCMMVRAEELAQRSDPSGRPLGRYASFPAVDAGGRSVWPARFSDVELARIRAMIGLANWHRNYALDPQDPGKPFQASWMQTYDEAKLDLGPLDVVAFLDPAISERSTACPRALVTVAADRLAGTRYVLDAWITRGSPREMIDALYGVYEACKPRVIGIETNGGFALVRPLLEHEARTRGWLPVRYVTHTQAKELRIERLAPAMEAGRWRFPRNPSAGVRALQDQFLSYPDGFVDGPDACAGCDEMLPDAMNPGSRAFGYRRLERRTEFAGV